MEVKLLNKVLGKYVVVGRFMHGSLMILTKHLRSALRIRFTNLAILKITRKDKFS